MIASFSMKISPNITRLLVGFGYAFNVSPKGSTITAFDGKAGDNACPNEVGVFGLAGRNYVQTNTNPDTTWLVRPGKFSLGGIEVFGK
jgi:hypothetical protein